MKNFRVFQNAEWPKGLGKPLALTVLSPDKLARKLHIKFVAHPVEPDQMRAVLLQSRKGRWFGLVHHEHQPVDGVNIWVRFEENDLDDALSDVLNSLSLKRSDLSWTALDSERGSRRKEKVMQTV